MSMVPSIPGAFSVIVATRDRPELLVDALAGVAEQMLAPLETRVADDGVTPLVPPAGISARVNPVWVRAGGGSIAAARNLAVRAARGGLLAFLDDDDRWSPEHLLALAVAFENPEVELAYTDDL